MIYLLLGAIAATVIIIHTVLLLLSPNQVSQFKDNNGVIIENSIAEKRFVNINSIRMGMFINSLF